MAPTMKHRRFYLMVWVNLAVMVVLIIIIPGDQTVSRRGLLHLLAYVLFYANVTGVLGIWAMGRLVQGLALRKLPLGPYVAGGIIVFTALGCLLAQVLSMEMGYVIPQNFWREYFHTLRVAAPLAIVFGLGAFAHESLRGRAQLMEEKLHEKEAAEERTRKLAGEARLRTLESRIHPHFLFNTLNSISSLIAVNPVRAEQIVGRLAALLRASLDTSNQPLIPLRQELTIVESYVDIERVRFGDKLRGSVEVPAELHDAKVPPMAVQSLVENAVKYGITPQSCGGELVIAASAENGNLRIEVRDTGPGFDLAAVPAGHGLDNLVERLHALFGEKARLNVLRRDGYTVVEMVLPRL
jgi:two-component system, LytTR family, sensor histidine kinase AlgZ